MLSPSNKMYTFMFVSGMSSLTTALGTILAYDVLMYDDACANACANARRLATYVFVCGTVTLASYVVPVWTTYT